MKIKWKIENVIADMEIGSLALRCDTEALISPKDSICTYCPLNVDENYCNCFDLGNVLK